MLKSSKFWIPLIAGVSVTLVVALLTFAPVGMLPRFSLIEHVFGRFIFPYWIVAIYLVPRFFNFGRVMELAMVFVFVFMQFPIYGTLIGYARIKNNLRRTLFWILGVHTLAFAVASFFFNWLKLT